MGFNTADFPLLRLLAGADEQAMGLGEGRRLDFVGKFSDDSLWHWAVTVGVLLAISHCPTPSLVLSLGQDVVLR